MTRKVFIIALALAGPLAFVAAGFAQAKHIMKKHHMMKGHKMIKT